MSIECALSGLVPGVLENPVLPGIPAEDVQEAHLGWTRVQLSRTVINPYWLQIRQTMEAMVQQGLAQAQAQIAQSGQALTPEQEVQLQSTVEIQVEATFAALLASVPYTITEEEEHWYAPPQREADAPGLTAALDAAWQALNIEWKGPDLTNAHVEDPDEDGDDEDSADDGDDE
jgi:hypothetical protein